MERQGRGHAVLLQISGGVGGALPSRSRRSYRSRVSPQRTSPGPHTTTRILLTRLVVIIMASKEVKTATLAGRLQHFAQSVDIVDDRTFEAVRRLVHQYVTSELKGAYFELMKEQITENGNRQLWLRTFWSSQGKDHFWPVRDGADNNPVAEAFRACRPLWLLDADKEPLGDVGRYRDHWSGLDLVTTYQPSVPPVRTLVAVPLYCRRLIGIYFIEIADYIELSEVATSELKRLADALAILLELWYVNRTQSEYTAEAIADLNQMLIEAKFPRLAKPHFFIAYPDRADPAVTGILTEVLNSFSERLEFTDWAEMSAAGNISLQIGKEIGRSRFGICYFSEPTTSGTHRWDDNKNVVFEAGMLHERTRSHAEQNQGEPTGWIPIREDDSPPAPFDFSGERILHVPRTSAGVDESRLRDLLTRRIDALLRQT
jgi:hypothetical protein